MLSTKIIKLTIVCDDKTKEYANFLRQLISAKDDTEDEVIGTADGTVEVVVWNEEQYADNAATLSSNQHVLFIGLNKTSKSEIASMNIQFDKCGMKYGWLGKRGMMAVDDALLSEEEYKEFISFCGTYKQYFEELAYKEPRKLSEEKEEVAVIETAETVDAEVVETATMPAPRKEKGKAFLAISKAASLVANKVINPVVSIVEAGAIGAYKGIDAHFMHKKITDQQYRALTVIIYLDGLKRFLEG